MTPTEITAARRMVTQLITELGQITGTLDTLEEINRLPTTRPKDKQARAEAAQEALDAAMQIAVTMDHELCPLFGEVAKGVVA